MFQTDDERRDERDTILSDISDLKAARETLEGVQDKFKDWAPKMGWTTTSEALLNTVDGIDALLHDEIDAAIGAHENRLDDLGDPDEEADHRSLVGYAKWATGAV